MCTSQWLILVKQVESEVLWQILHMQFVPVVQQPGRVRVKNDPMDGQLLIIRVWRQQFLGRASLWRRMIRVTNIVEMIAGHQIDHHILLFLHSAKMGRNPHGICLPVEALRLFQVKQTNSEQFVELGRRQADFTFRTPLNYFRRLCPVGFHHLFDAMCALWGVRSWQQEESGIVSTFWGYPSLE